MKPNNTSLHIVTTDSRDAAVLYTVAQPVTNVQDPMIQEAIARMCEYVQNGEYVAGLAAPQIGISQRFIVCKWFPDYDDMPEEVVVMINPQITQTSKQMQSFVEGCYSVTGKEGSVRRHRSITVEYIDEHGDKQEIDAEGYNAQIIQHEIDHLDGILFTDRCPKVKSSKGSQ